MKPGSSPARESDSTHGLQGGWDFADIGIAGLNVLPFSEIKAVKGVFYGIL
jgi:hypothetical protein